MPTWAAILLGCAGLGLTLGTILFKSGSWAGDNSAEVKGLAKDLAGQEVEIKSLREWRHSVGNAKQETLAFDMLIERVKRLETKIFNGIK